MSTSTLSSVHPALIFKPRTESNPTYVPTDIYPNTGNRQVLLNNTTHQEVEFEVPTEVFNLARSILQFDLKYTDSTAGTQAITDPLKNLDLFVDRSCISLIERIEVRTRSGVILLDQDYQQMISKIMNTYCASESCYKKQHGKWNDFDRFAAAKDWLMTEKADDLQHHADKFLQNMPSCTLVQKGYLPKTTNDRAANVLPQTFRYNIPLGHFKQSFLSVDKDLYFGGQVLIIKITFAPMNDWVTRGRLPASKMAIDPYSAAVGTADNARLTTNFMPPDAKHNVISKVAASVGEPLNHDEGPWNPDDFLNANDSGVSPGLNTSGDNTMTLTIENLNMRLMRETNPALVVAVKNKVNSSEGLSFFFPEVFVWRETRTLTADTPTNISHLIRLNRSHGLRLQGHYFLAVPYLTVPAGFTGAMATYNNGTRQFGVDGKAYRAAPIRQVKSSLNNRPLQQRTMIVVNDSEIPMNDTYDELSCFFKASLADSQQRHLANFCIPQRYDGFSAMKKDWTNVVSGLPLADDVQIVHEPKVEVKGTQMVLWFLAICQRSCTIGTDRITKV